MSEDTDLNERLSSGGEPRRAYATGGVEVAGRAPTPVISRLASQDGHNQWTSPDGERFFPAGKTSRSLTPGLYDILVDQSGGLFFQRVPIKTEGLLRFPHSNSGRVVAEIQTFWTRREVFQDFGLVHKRGIVLWGPPGSGKSSTIQLILVDVVERGGVAVRYDDPHLFLMGMRVLRTIQPETPVVVLLEDIDSLITRAPESLLLNILDGVERIDRVVFLATTNYPENLGARIINRPSRFDKRFKVGHPTPESRRMYFEHLVGGRQLPEVDLTRWVVDTEGMSLAHLKELFVAVVILGDDYEEAVRTLRTMRENIASSSERPGMGLHLAPTSGRT